MFNDDKDLTVWYTNDGTVYTLHNPDLELWTLGTVSPIRIDSDPQVKSDWLFTPQHLQVDAHSMLMFLNQFMYLRKA